VNDYLAKPVQRQSLLQKARERYTHTHPYRTIWDINPFADVFY